MGGHRIHAEPAQCVLGPVEGLFGAGVVGQGRPVGGGGLEGPAAPGGATWSSRLSAWPSRVSACW
ncbi:hypothetical protein GQS52_12015 [Streptomyces sp. SCUT-3]|uniref:hypothetical protein n=1 Tax=Streptomyces sp. SCUT-3 TaxID=2684469 RepID=UPI0015F8D0FC|nr:hypothetical protein [Streptomyces sp. SCUT-3]QMV22398.1 hypothetical protein GQS52_12015 [Streptomyces sp. SCUT-3]